MFPFIQTHSDANDANVSLYRLAYLDPCEDLRSGVTERECGQPWSRIRASLAKLPIIDALFLGNRPEYWGSIVSVPNLCDQI